MAKFVKGDVIVINFPYSNLKETKRRPVLVLKVPKGGDLIAIQITGSVYNKKMEIPIKETDFQKGNLNRLSFARIDKIASIEKSLINYRIGSLKRKKFEEIQKRVIEFLLD